jgi:hypothetical protein
MGSCRAISRLAHMGSKSLCHYQVAAWTENIYPIQKVSNGGGAEEKVSVFKK